VNDAAREYLEREQWQITDIEAGLRELEAGDIATDAEVESTFSRITTPEAMERARLNVAAEQW
jgi:predicted transcriptional regulator